MAADKLRVICGPTAAGKSSLAMKLAESFGAAIVSADSRQVYRKFDIGTGKATNSEQSRVSHFCIDVVSPEERYSAAQWSGDATAAVRLCYERGLIPLIVGGTGFYLRALFSPLFAQPVLDADRRSELARHLEAMTSAELRRWCDAIDPARSHLGRAQLMRAVEVAILTGERLSDLQSRSVTAPQFAARYLILDPGNVLRVWIEKRVRGMFSDGWEDEVRQLLSSTSENAPAWSATGYGTVRSLVRNEISGSAALERIVIDTRQYAKRQRTWFRHQLRGEDVTRLDASAGDLYERAAAWWIGEQGEQAA